MTLALDGWHPAYRESSDRTSINTNSKYLGYNKKERIDCSSFCKFLLNTNHEIKQAFLSPRHFSLCFSSNQMSKALHHPVIVMGSRLSMDGTTWNN